MLRTARLAASLALVALLFTSQTFAQSVDTTRVGAIRLSYVTSNSRVGKAAIAQLEQLNRKKSLELGSKAAEVQKQQGRAQERARVELERLQQDAQAEIDALRSKFDAEFQVKLAPRIT